MHLKCKFKTQKILNGTGYTGGANLDKEALIQKLKDSWLEQAEKIVYDALGNPGTVAQEVNVKFQGDGPGGAMARAGGYEAPGKLQLLLDPADFANSSEEYQKVTIVHEMVHMQMASTGALQNLGKGGTMHWFAEGIAEFVPGEHSFEDLKSYVGSKGAASLVNTNITGGNNLSGEYYLASYAATTFLNSKLTGSMENFINSLEANGATFESALKANTAYTSEAAFMNDYRTTGTAFLSTLVSSTTSSQYTLSTGLDTHLDNALAIAEGSNAKYTYNFNTGGSLILHIGANEQQNLKVDLPFISAAGLGIAEANVSKGSDGAITIYDNAIENVSMQRAQMGAYQNRLEHTVNNLGTTSENLTAAESRIRDTDMAKEMMNFTKQNILMQAAQTMLSQANQQPQGVLQLLG